MLCLRSILRHRLVASLQPAWVPALTAAGFQVEAAPAALLGLLRVAAVRAEAGPELCQPARAAHNCQRLLEEEDGAECRVEHSGRQLLSPLSPGLQEAVLTALLPRAQAWAGITLSGTAVYGIRSYR